MLQSRVVSVVRFHAPHTHLQTYVFLTPSFGHSVITFDAIRDQTIEKRSFAKVFALAYRGWCGLNDAVAQAENTTVRHGTLVQYP